MPRSCTAILVLLLSAPAFVGCSGIGPRRIEAERFDYNEAVVRTWNEQMLLNLVRLRYRDTPYFLNVASVSTQYEVTGSLSASAKLGAGRGNNNDYGVGADAGYTERPTVVYSPLVGEDFVKRLLSPLPMQSLLLLGGSGWRVDRVLRCGVARVNDVWNAPRATGPTPDEPPEFETFNELTELLWELQRTRSISVVERDGDLYWNFLEEDAPAEALRRVKRLLGQPEDQNSFRLVSTRSEVTETDLRIVPRSIIGIMHYLSQAVEPPERDRQAGRVTLTYDDRGREFDWSAMMDGLFRVRSSEDPPEDAFVSVNYRDAWFYIEDNDLVSKSTFGLLSQMFNLQAGDTRGGGPLLTLPLGP